MTRYMGALVCMQSLGAVSPKFPKSRIADWQSCPKVYITPTHLCVRDCDFDRTPRLSCMQ